MEPGIDYRKVAPRAYQAALGLEKYLGQCGIEETLIHLIQVRGAVASKVNEEPDLPSFATRRPGVRIPSRPPDFQDLSRFPEHY